MARTIINGMLNDEGWDAMSMLDWEEGRIYEIAPGMKVRILPTDVAPALEAALQRRTGPSARRRSDSSETDTTVSCSW